MALKSFFASSEEEDFTDSKISRISNNELLKGDFSSKISELNYPDDNSVLPTSGLINKDFNFFLPKILRFCLYQERSSYETTQKLIEIECPADVIPKIIGYLIKERYLDDKRFAYEYTHGKFILKKWGRLKIRKGLMDHKLPTDIIEYSLYHTFDEADYKEMAFNLAQNQWKKYNNKHNLATKAYVARLLQQKGYEWDLIHDILRTLGFS